MSRDEDFRDGKILEGIKEELIDGAIMFDRTNRTNRTTNNRTNRTMFNFGKHVVSSIKSRVYNPFTANELRIPNEEPTDRSADSNSAMNAASTSTPAVGRKRSRSPGDTTPTLVSPNSAGYDSPDDNLIKRQRVEERNSLHVPASLDAERFQSVAQESLLLELIPQDVLQSNICCFLGEAKDHRSLQLSCRKLHEVSNKLDLLSQVDLTGDHETGKGSILHGVDVPAEALQKLYKFAAVGNQQALYM